MTKHYTVVLVAMLLALGIAVAAVAARPGPERPVCFPASGWDADQGKRPCIVITRVEEDGSFAFRASDADGTERYTSGVGALDR